MAEGSFTKDKVPPAADAGLDTEFKRGLGLFDATMVVVGSMIGSGIFIVSADMARRIGSPGWLLVAWLITGVLTVAAALSYGELAALMPRAGGQYVFLREAFNPLCGFLYGWTLFLVIQTGTIAAVGVAFAKFLGVLWPAVSETKYLVPPIHLTAGYAVSLSYAQLVGVLLIALLTMTNLFGIDYGKFIQNVFTVSKTGALLGLIVLCLLLGWNATAVNQNFGDFWAPRTGSYEAAKALMGTTALGLFAALCVTQTQSLFSADAWNNITFTAGEVRNPRRTVAWAMALGTMIVIALYLLANVGYLVTLPLEAIQTAPADRVGTAAMERIFPGVAVTLMAVAILISTFGCNNGLILAGARAYYAMARDGLFFRAVGRLNKARVPAWGLVLQGVWAALLVLPRTVQQTAPDYPVVAGTVGALASPSGDGPWGAAALMAAATPVKYGSLYNDLLDYVISAALLFYILTIVGLFVLRIRRPDAPRPYQAFGYPVVPALYIVGAGVILVVLLWYQWATTLPGFAIVLLGVPVYSLWRLVRGRNGLANLPR
jgi:APA family basic amino acid/polyamine antiporter